MECCVLVHMIKCDMINVHNKHSKSFYRCKNVSECRKNTVKQTKYVNKVTNSENRIKTKWKFCTKKILRSRAQNDNITSSKRTQKQKTINNKKMNGGI